MTSQEAHCFDMELARLQMHLDHDAPAPSHWIALIAQSLESGKGITNSTPELFGYVQGMYPAAITHLASLRPQDPDMWERALSDPLLLLESGMTEEAAAAAHQDALDGIVRLPCGHTATEHMKLMDQWYERNLEATRFRRSTLYHVWNLPAEEKLYGKQFISWYDLEREIEEEVDRRNRDARRDEGFFEGFITMFMRDDETLDREIAAAKAHEQMDRLDITRAQNTRTDAIALMQKHFRILGNVPAKYREIVEMLAEEQQEDQKAAG